jgi:galactonate dehydratase
VPVYDLLGGRVHDDLPAYANAWYGTGSSSVAEIARAAKARWRSQGYRGLKLDPFTSADATPTRRERAPRCRGGRWRCATPSAPMSRS